MKYLKAVVVFLMLVGFPAGSWYFLQHGLDWRRVKRTELVTKSHLINDVEWTPEERQLLTSRLKNRTTLCVMKSAMANRDQEVYDQFKDAFTFQALLENELPAKVASQFSSYDYLLIDTAMQVRQVYAGYHDSVHTRIVEDIALIVPQRKEVDIKLRRKNQDESQ